MRKITRKGIIRKLDTFVSNYVREKEGFCVVCGSTQNLTNGHLFSRVSYSTRWDISGSGNCHAQCLKCNMSHEYDPYPYTDWYITNFGKEAYDALHKRFKETRPYKTWELIELYEKLEKETKLT